MAKPIDFFFLCFFGYSPSAVASRTVRNSRSTEVGGIEEGMGGDSLSSPASSLPRKNGSAHFDGAGFSRHELCHLLRSIIRKSDLDMLNQLEGLGGYQHVEVRKKRKKLECASIFT
jgi:hypothetical protein